VGEGGRGRGINGERGKEGKAWPCSEMESVVGLARDGWSGEGRWPDLHRTVDVDEAVAVAVAEDVSRGSIGPDEGRWERKPGGNA
jgi:hypothetical protein